MSSRILRIGRNNQLRLPAEWLAQLQLEPGDELMIHLFDHTIEISKADGGGHPYADWRSISHDLIEDNPAAS